MLERFIYFSIIKCLIKIWVIKIGLYIPDKEEWDELIARLEELESNQDEEKLNEEENIGSGDEL